MRDFIPVKSKIVNCTFILFLSVILVGNTWFPMSKRNITLASSAKPLNNCHFNRASIYALDESVGKQEHNTQGQRFEERNISKKIKNKNDQINHEKEKKVYKKTVLNKRMKKANLSKNHTILYKKLNAKNASGILIKKISKRKADHREELNAERQNNDQTLHEQVDENVIMTSLGNLFAKIVDGSHVNAEPPNKSVICGLSISNIPYVILNNGKKVFEGGKLDNGCIVDNINQNYIILDCNGQKRKLTM